MGHRDRVLGDKVQRFGMMPCPRLSEGGDRGLETEDWSAKTVGGFDVMGIGKRSKDGSIQQE